MGDRIGDATRAKIAAVWPEIVARLAAGHLVRDILRDLKISDTEKRGYLVSVPGAREEWDSAREASADVYMDEAIATAYSRPGDNVEAAHARTKIDTLKWAARIRNPRLYGDKAQLDITHKHVDLTRIIQDAQQRLAAARPAGAIIDGTAERVTDSLPAELEALRALL